MKLLSEQFVTYSVYVLLTLLTSTWIFQLHLTSVKGGVCLMPNDPFLPPITRGLLPHADVKQNGKSISLFHRHLISYSHTITLTFYSYSYICACTYALERMHLLNQDTDTIAHMHSNTHLYINMHTPVVSYLYYYHIHTNGRARAHTRMNAHANIYTYTWYPTLPASLFPQILWNQAQRHKRVSQYQNQSILFLVWQQDVSPVMSYLNQTARSCI